MRRLTIFLLLLTSSTTGWSEKLTSEELANLKLAPIEPAATEQQIESIKQTVSYLTKGRGEVRQINENHLMLEVDCGHGVVAEQVWGWATYNENDPDSPISINPNIHGYPYIVRSDRADAKVYVHLQNLIGHGNPLWCDYRWKGQVAK